MLNGNINDITKLKFYTDKGTELSAQKSYILRWELIPGKLASEYLQEIPTGYFIGDVDLQDKDNIQIQAGSFIAGIINSGKFFVRLSTSKSTDGHGFPIYSYDDISENLIDDSEFLEYIENILFDESNTVRIIIDDNGHEYTQTFNINDIFEFNLSLEPKEYFNIQKVYTGDNLYGSNEYYILLGLTNIDLKESIDTGNPYIQDILTSQVPNIGLYFPFIRYNMNFYQDKISSDFIAANTLLILEQHLDENNNLVYEKPYINSNNPYVILFQPTINSEIQIISNDSEYNILYKPEAEFSLADPEQSNQITPLSFSFGFQAKEEGAYQNLIGIYMRTLDNYGNDITFFMGCVSVKTEVEGEDERFRTLLTNFGVPDPVLYSNLFAEQDYQEEGKDYRLINKKSKELFLSYSEIFSYVGTYKALIKAIKFLGYTDIIFKEWYTLKDSNDKETDIAVQVFDSETGKMLKSKLAEYGISIEDFEKYNKINKISMVYHLNEIDNDNYEKIEQTLIDPNDPSQDGKKFMKITEVPLTKPLYAYRNAEILAKLFAVKKWLEYNIIGVGAYISDISGEGIYFGWQKTQGYETTHHLADFSQSQYYTADVKCVLPFIDSSGKIACTLNELNDSVRLEDYENIPLDTFVRNTLDISFGDIIEHPISNSLETPVLGDEYEFELNITPDSGTLYEWSQDNEQQLIVDNGEVKLLFNDMINETSIDSSCLPIITLENANIHLPYGKWTKNIQWAINEAIDPLTGNVNYRLKNTQEGIVNNMYSVINKRYFILKATSEDAYIKYTDRNKWDVPMFIIKGYSIVNMSVDENYIDEYTFDPDSEYILEILKGDMLFKRIDNVSAILSFSNDNINQEQDIKVRYTYYSDRKQFVQYDSSMFEELEEGPDIDASLFDQEIQESKDLNEKIDNSIVNDISTFVKSQYANISYNEASTYLNSTEYQQEVQKFLDKKKDLLEKQEAYNQYESIYENNYKANRTIDVDVTRLGDYSIISRSYDKYNNIFVSKYDKTAKMSVKPIAIDTYTDVKFSNNTPNFYKDNIDGSICSSDEIKELFENIDKEPLYPTNYKIYDFDNNIEKHSLTFDNISYAYDTPKNNDYLIIDNNKDKIISFESEKIIVNDRNEDFIDRYRVSDKILITAYNQHEHKDYYVIEADIIDIEELEKNEIKISLSESIADEFDDTYDYYIKNVTEYELPSDFIIKNDFEKQQSIIYIESYNPFRIEDVIKLRYVAVEESYEKPIINEVTYRILNIEKSIDENSNIIIYKYTLNGLVNQTILSDIETEIKVYIMFANQLPVHYTLRVVKDAHEYNYSISQNQSVLRDDLNYNSMQLLLDNYIDDNYCGYNYDYDIYGLKDQWFDAQTLLIKDESDFENVDLYYYHDFPITVTQNNYLIFKDHDRENAFRDGYKVEWAIKAKLLDEKTNLNEYINNDYDEILFRSANKILSIKPDLVGPQNIELICTDIYGNKVINAGNCKLNIKIK